MNCLLTTGTNAKRQTNANQLRVKYTPLRGNDTTSADQADSQPGPARAALQQDPVVLPAPNRVNTRAPAHMAEPASPSTSQTDTRQYQNHRSARILVPH